MFHTSRAYGLNVYGSGNNKLLKGFTHAHTQVHTHTLTHTCDSILKFASSHLKFHLYKRIFSQLTLTLTLTLTAHLNDFQKTPTQWLTSAQAPPQAQPPQLHTLGIFFFAPSQGLHSHISLHMCSITSVLQNVFYLHRLPEFISFLMPHQRFMCSPSR